MKTRSALALLAAAGLAVSVTACAAPAATPDSGTLSIGQVVDVTSWDPADIGTGFYLQYMQPLYDSLLQLDADGAVVGALATTWEWDESRTELTLALRDDVTFTDGEAFDAAAVVANIDALKAGSGGASGQLASVEEATEIDELTVALHLSEPDPGLESSLAESSFMASPAAIEAGNLATEPVGSGPYTYDAAASTPGSEYIFVRNEDYWNPDAYPFEQVKIRPLADDRARLAALQSGAVNAASGLPGWIKDAEAQGLVTQENPVDWTGLFINDRTGARVPALGDVRVRQAINYAFDREGILESIQLGLGDVTTQIFNPATVAYDTELDSFYTFDPEKAKALLADAGYPNGFDLPMPSSDWSAAYDAVVQQQLAEVGIRVQYESIPTTNVLARLPDFGAHWFSWSMFLDPWSDVRDLVAPTGAGNYQSSSDDTVASLIEQIRLAPAEQAGPIYQELNGHLVEQGWFAPWFVTNRVYFHTPDVEVTQLPGNIVPPLSLYAPSS